jgi:hypothetical protein
MTVEGKLEWPMRRINEQAFDDLQATKLRSITASTFGITSSSTFLSDLLYQVGRMLNFKLIGRVKREI